MDDQPPAPTRKTRRRTASEIVQQDGADALADNFQELRVDQYARIAVAQAMLTGGMCAAALMNQTPGDAGFENALTVFDFKVRAIAARLLED